VLGNLLNVRILKKTGFFVLHIFQIMISLEGGLYVSGIFAHFLLGVQFIERDYFVSAFRISPCVVGLVGSVVWFVAALIEV
jgi:hypothetical protein